MDPRSAGGVGRNTSSQRAADSAAAERNSRGGAGPGTFAGNAGAAMQRALVSNGDTWAGQVQRGLDAGANGTINMGTGPGSMTIGPNQPDGRTSYGAPIHTVPNGTYAGISVARDPSHWAGMQNQVATYNDAARAWNQSAQQRSIANLLNNMAPMGFSMQRPEYDKPKTYTGGDYHLGVNPANLAGGLLGGALFPGAGTITGPALGAAYTALGGSNVMLGGPGVPSSWDVGAGSRYPGGQGAPGTQMAGAQGLGKQNSAADHLMNLATLNSQVSGNVGAPVSSGTTTTPGTPTTPGQPQAPNGLDYLQRMARMQSITPGYGVQLPSYRYTGRATV